MHFHLLQSNDSVINFYSGDLEGFLEPIRRSKNSLHPTGYPDGYAYAWWVGVRDSQVSGPAANTHQLCDLGSIL